MASGYKGTGHIWISGATGGSQLACWEPRGPKGNREGEAAGPEAPCVPGLDLKVGCFMEVKILPGSEEGHQERECLAWGTRAVECATPGRRDSGSRMAGPHSLRYFHVAVSEPSPGVPHFVSVGYVDGNVIIRYDSETGRAVPRADWMAANLDQAYWDRETQVGQSTQQVARVSLEALRSRYNQSGGAHTVQVMYGCDLLEDGSTRGYRQYAYDGRDFIAFDMDTMTFTAADAAAQITKRRWEEDGTVAERRKQYLNNTCIEWLRKYVSYGRAVLERKEPPAVRVSGREAHGILTLRCRAHGFYPRPITVSWLKDGEVRDQETEWGSVAPNSDGTYYTWASIEARPGEQDKYRCRVEHASLPEPGLYAWETESNLWAIVLGVAVAVGAVAGICGFVVWKRKSGKTKAGYGMASNTDSGSGSTGTGVTA